VWLERSLSRRTALCICVSDYELRLSRAVGLRYRRAEVIPNGVDFEAFKADAAAPRPEAVAGCVSRLTSQKAIDVLLHAAADARWPAGVRLELIGDGPDRDELESLARQLGLNGTVDFLGYQPDVEAMLRGWSVLVLPSRYEAGVPLTLLEAIAMEVPVVTTAVADVERLAPDGLTVVPVGDAAALAGAVAELTADRAAAVARAARLRLAAQERYSLAAQLRRVAATYRELVRG
jgi:glycosyltransferase involved in cell wall biosynthesis